MRRIGFASIALMLLAGCSLTPTARVHDALVKAGLPEPMAGCMAERLATKLSIAQLEQLKTLKDARTQDGRISVKTLVKRLRDLDDPEIARVTSRAAIGCAIRG